MAEAHDIVATSKFKSSKPASSVRSRQQQDDVVDDWDAESSDDGNSKDNVDSKQADVFHASKEQWSEANARAPAAVPIVASGHARTLPGAAYGDRMQTKDGQQARDMHNGGMTIAAAPPRILQRPKEAVPGMRSDGTAANVTKGSQEHKTVEQRQEEYRLARERIFGVPSRPSSSGRGRSSKEKP
ncbi:SUZ domain protein [Kalmanozyma brasiliensis GHG001]|uniref:SUZ domain protein n=1 Tax=Kalmanozyma brasiliensis (strain GHG001) TaxID=1365824 RepID=UPI002867FF75|nr:SUZ domain protein [Kalmanozyma brasiliensis GHG001]EST10155.2 SUZ domain protein [Kalmanozyma brasiliensis GHG001]